MAESLRVEIPWYELDDDSDPAWRATFCLYAYLHPDRNWLLYIGKADYQTLRQRLHGGHKADLFNYLCRRYDIDCFRILQVTYSSGQYTETHKCAIIDVLRLLLFRNLSIYLRGS